MLAATGRSGANAIPLSQNTAPVIEYRCLFTHDIVRKQKRWQDGFLNYHTFNRRIMVYDTSRNFIGDTHFTHNQEPQEGDELNLDKGGVIVEVSEPVGRTDTDVTELVQKRQRKSPVEGPTTTTSVLRSSPLYTDVSSPARSAPRKSQLFQKHKSLTSLLGTPTGPTGKAALPIRSPFQQRYGEENVIRPQETRPAKRRKLEAAVGGRASTSLQDASAARAAQAVSRAKASVAQHARPNETPVAPRKQQPPGNDVIDLCSDDIDPVHDFEITPARPSSQTEKRGRIAFPQHDGLPEPIVRRKEVALPEMQARPVSPPRQISDEANAAGVPVEKRRPKHVNATRVSSPRVETAETLRKGGSLKLVSNAPRKMLMCQDPYSRRSISRGSTEVDMAKKGAAKGDEPASSEAPPTVSTKKRQSVKARIVLSSPEPSEIARPDIGPEVQAPKYNGRQPDGVGKHKSGRVQTRDRLHQGIRQVHEQIGQDLDLPQVDDEPVSYNLQASIRPQAHTPIVPDRGAPAAKKTVSPLKRKDKPPVKQKARTPMFTESSTKGKQPARQESLPEILPEDDTDKGPWSIEAFDLFDWRPPDRDAHRNKIPK